MATFKVRELPLAFLGKVRLLRQQLAVFLASSPNKIQVALEWVGDRLASQISLSLHQVAFLVRRHRLRLLALATYCNLDSKTSLRVADLETKRNPNPDFLVHQASFSSQLRRSPDSQHNWEEVLLRDSAVVKVLLAIYQVAGSSASRTKDSSHKTLNPRKLEPIIQFTASLNTTLNKFRRSTNIISPNRLWWEKIKWFSSLWRFLQI